MAVVGVDSYGAYLEYLEVHPGEFRELFNTVLINVTSFFRDEAAWDYVRGDLVPALLARRPAPDQIRVWSAGCANGAEAYSVAMAFAEEMSEGDFRARVKIYATDVDEEALTQGRHAAFSGAEVEAVPPELVARYFEGSDSRYTFRPDLRRAVIFGRHDLVQDAPISRIDLLLCRNTLMYFNAETQARVLRHFHFALHEPGVLMLGKSEMMIAHRELFAASDLKKRIFVKQPRSTVSSRAVAFTAEAGERLEGDDDRATRDAALELGPHAQVIVARDGRLTFANLAARALFQISPDDFGRPVTDLPFAHRPMELRGWIDQALRERRRVSAGATNFMPQRGDERRLDVTVTPLLTGENVAIGVSVAFEDVTRYAALQSELANNRRDLELA